MFCQLREYLTWLFFRYSAPLLYLDHMCILALTFISQHVNFTSWKNLWFAFFSQHVNNASWDYLTWNVISNMRIIRHNSILHHFVSFLLQAHCAMLWYFEGEYDLLKVWQSIYFTFEISFTGYCIRISVLHFFNMFVRSTRVLLRWVFREVSNNTTTL